MFLLLLFSVFLNQRIYHMSEKVFLKISEISQKNIYVGVAF